MLERFKMAVATSLLRKVGTVVTINSQSVRVYERDENNNVTHAAGTVTITDGGAGYAKGCFYVKTNASGGTDGTYNNIGTTTSCQFVQVDATPPTSITLPQAQIMVGGNDGLAHAQPVSGFATITKDGFFSQTVTAKNTTGGTLNPGTLVLAELDGTGQLIFVKADNTQAPAMFVITSAIANNATGVGYQMATLTGVDTSSASAPGATVWLGTAGAYIISDEPPTGASVRGEVVGLVGVKDAVNGSIFFLPGPAYNVVLPGSDLQDASVGAGKMKTAPSAVVVYSGKQNNGGGSATIAITVSGVLATDQVFAQVEASTNAVTVQKVTPSTDTVTVVLSADPGASTKISYLVFRQPQ